MTRIRPTARRLDDGAPITFAPTPIVSADSAILTMGSCFAVEIRDVLRQRGLDVLPDYTALRPMYADVFTYVADQGRVPLTDDIVDLHVMQWYFTATIRQEFERAFGVWRQEPSDLWHARGIWQDPYRRSVFSESKDALWVFLETLNRLMRDAIEQADVYILTLGLTEAWRKKDDGRFASAFPGPRRDQRGVQETEFVLLNHADCINDLTSVCDGIFNRWPNKHVVVTVSPVPLARTFTDQDHAIGNCDSKSTLRSAAGEIARRYDHVHYFHSYELCTTRPQDQVFREDGRHVQRNRVAEIVSTFIDQFGDGLVSAPASRGIQPLVLPTLSQA